MTAFESWLDRVAYVQWAFVPVVVAAAVFAGLARMRAATRAAIAGVLAVAMIVPCFVPVLGEAGPTLDAVRRDFAATPYARPVAERRDDLAFRENAASSGAPIASRAAAHERTSGTMRVRIPTWLWLTGTVFLLARAVLGIVVTRRRLRRMPDAPLVVAREVASIADELGAAIPRCVFSSERCSPAVYCLGSPVLVLPAALWRGLDAEARRSLLVHELAHVKRRDGWLRAIAGTACCLLWWNPVVWWLRARLRTHSEDACDAWVGAVDENAPTTYTRALLDTERFLGGLPLRGRPALVPVVSGRARALARRMRRIVHTAPHRASWLGSAFVVLLGVGAAATSWLGVQSTAPPRAAFSGAIADPLARGRALGLRDVVGRLLLRVEGDSDPARLPAAVEALREGRTAEQRRLAADAIGNLFEQGTPGVAALLHALASDPSPSVRREAVDAIGRIGPHLAPDVLPALLDARRLDVSSRVRREVDDVLDRWHLVGFE